VHSEPSVRKIHLSQTSLIYVTIAADFNHFKLCVDLHLASFTCKQDPSSDHMGKDLSEDQNQIADKQARFRQ